MASRAGLSQQSISVVELGRLGEVDLATLRRVAAALDATLEFQPRWRGPELARLLDADHATLVDAAVAILTEAGWETVVEWTFSHFGERGSVDVLAWQAAERALLVIEVKSSVIEVGALHAGVDRKARLAPQLLPDERGWRPLVVGAVVVLPSETAIYQSIRRHAAQFAASFPSRTGEVRRWIVRPERPLRGLWFLTPTSGTGTTPGLPPSRRRRVRRPRSRPTMTSA